ncbi:acyl transferase domain-containing protein [Xylariaceae sp. FL1651]|nr:acyl transferase domain-containing protein [Xylariaceae sp. FL1651]
MACRLPGGIESPSELWEFILAKRDARVRVPKSRYNIDAHYSASGKAGTVKTAHGYFLDEDLSALDASFFTMSPSEISRCDPQQRKLLEVARDCIIDAGETMWKGEEIGVFVGSFGDEWATLLDTDPQQYGAYRVLGSMDFSLANRVSYEMGLRGPSVTIKTACSASMVALDAACKAIVSGDLIMIPSNTAKLGGMGVVSPEGSCKPFSADADGYIRAEAISATPVRAVIRATAVNHNGKSAVALIQRAYKLARIVDTSQTAFFECHGTGTMAGDTLETKSIARVFGGSGIYIGSVKANVGHSEGASGLTGVIKGVLALEHMTIPPNIKFNAPNPNIPFADGKLTVPVEALPWPKDRFARVSVNSFGIGGTNAHTILDSAASHHASSEPIEASYSPQLLLYSANTPESLGRMVEKFESYLSKYPERIADLAYTLALRRQHLRHRAFVVANRDQIGRASQPVAAQQSSNIVMVFTGQGAQWPTMGRDLCRENTHFRNSIRALDKLLSKLGDDGPKWKIEQELRKPAKTSRLGEAELSQPICTAIQIALVDTLASFGIHADAVVGHSSGEIAAAYAAGALTAEEAITAAFYRGRIANVQKKAGSMAAVGMSWEETKSYLAPQVTIACDNSPRSVTISGDTDQVEQVIRNINTSRPEALTRLLKVDKAYHSHHMSEIGDQYEALISCSLQENRPRKPFFSTVTGDLLSEGALDARYWRRNLESPVLFRAAVSRIAQHELGQNALFVEIGPHSALAGPLLQIMADNSKTSFQYVATMIRGQRCTDSMLAAVGKMHCLGVPVDFRSLYSSDHYQCLTGLPGYPFDRVNSHWHETRLTKDWLHAQYRHHDLLGSRARESTDLEPSWRNLFQVEDAPWVRDHRVEDEIVFPFAAYVAMAAEAARQTCKAEQGFRIRNLLVRTAMVVSEEHPIELVTNLRRHALTKTLDSQWWEFSISSCTEGAWTKHCSGEITSLDKGLGMLEDSDELPRHVSAKKWYAVSRSGLTDIRTSTSRPERATATIKNDSQNMVDQEYHLHPTILDAALQLLSCSAQLGHTRRATRLLATSIEELDISRFSKSGKGSVVGSGKCAADGKVCEDKADDNDAAARSEDQLGPTTTIRPEFVNKLASLDQLSIAYTQKALEHIEVTLPSHKRFKSWISASSPGLSSIQSSDNDQVLNTAHAASTILNVAVSAPSAISAKKSLADIVNSEDALEDFRNFVNKVDLSSFRILELGAGTGAATRRILNDLGGLYSKYTFSDTSSRLFSIVQEKFQGVQNLDFEVLDIEGQYDIIIANNVVHGTSDVAKSLSNEVDPSCKWVHFILGLETDFATKIADAHPGSTPYRTMDDWKAHLTAAGFMAPHLAKSDVEAPFTVNNILVARKGQHKLLEKRVTLLTVNRESDVESIELELDNRGYHVFRRSLDENLEPETDVISLLDQDGPFLDSLNPNNYDRFKAILEEIGSRKLVWLTHLSPIECADPRYAQVLGLSRTLRAELGLFFAVVQSDCGFSDPRIVDVFENIRLEQCDEQQFMLPEYEYALCKDQVMVGRWFPVKLADELAVHADSDTARIEPRKTGIHAEVGWAWAEPRAPGANEVEVEMYSSAVNDTDVAMATEYDESVKPGFGNQGAGIIRRVGSAIQDLQVGDRVIVCSNGTLSLSVTVPAILCVKMPDSLDFDEGATIGRAYSTALYSLIDVGGLQSGQTVLIHDASSDVGNIAAQIALRLGAQVFLTVDSDEKAGHLSNIFNIPCSKIFSSTDSSFVGSIERATNAKGVDLVLNSLTGELLNASWQCVAEFGKLVDLSKKDLAGAAKLDMDLFLRNRSYCYVDIDRTEYQNPELMNRLLRLSIDQCDQGYMKKIVPTKVFSGDRIQDAFHHVRQNGHGENVVIRLRASDQSPQLGGDIARRKRMPVFDSSASYLLVGGLGGIGRAVAVWMAENGARHIIFLSKSAGDRSEHQALILELHSLGCEATLIKGDVTDVADTARAIEAAGEAPLKGVMQMSMVLRDRLWQNMLWNDWHECCSPKIKGTWNLHTLLQDKALDFFIVFSSIIGIIGSASQANYASANAFMEALCQYRCRAGLKASTINVGVVLDIGVVGENENLTRRMKGLGLHGLRESVILDALTVAASMPSENTLPVAGWTDPCSITLGLAPTSLTKLEEKHSAWRKEPRMAAFRTKTTSRSDGGEVRGDELKALLSSARQDPAILQEPEALHTLAYAIGAKVLTLLFRPAEELETIIKTGLSDIGMDSLVAMELRAWWKQTFNTDIKVLDMLRMGNIEILGKYAANEMAKAFAT